jgi:PAS domain-containing protein
VTLDLACTTADSRTGEAPLFSPPTPDNAGRAVSEEKLRVADKEREHVKKRPAQMEARYSGLLEAAPDALIVVDQSGEIVLVNLQAEKEFGYRRDELFGQKVTNIIPAGFAERLAAGRQPTMRWRSSASRLN